MTNTTSTMCGAALIVAAFAAAPLALAGPSPASPEVKKALAMAKQSPAELRRFIQRTRMIYALDYFEVMRLYEAARTANSTTSTSVASVSER